MGSVIVFCRRFCADLALQSFSIKFGRIVVQLRPQSYARHAMRCWRLKNTVYTHSIKRMNDSYVSEENVSSFCPYSSTSRKNRLNHYCKTMMKYFL